jgi:hypothetical protein
MTNPGLNALGAGRDAQRVALGDRGGGTRVERARVQRERVPIRQQRD